MIYSLGPGPGPIGPIHWAWVQVRLGPKPGPGPKPGLGPKRITYRPPKAVDREFIGGFAHAADP